MEQSKVTLSKNNFTKWRLLWILIAAAWLFVFLKLLVGALFEKNTSLVAAFSVTNPQEISATVEVTAKCPEGAISNADKYFLLEEVADAIGLTVDAEPEVTKSSTRQEISFFKDALAADTEVKVITLIKDDFQDKKDITDNIISDFNNTADIANTIKNVEDMEDTERGVSTTYLYAKICLNKSLDTVLAYKTLLEAAMSDLSCTEISATIQLVGDYAGYLPLERRDEITEDILKALSAEIVYEYREHDLYTVYAYTAGLENYITVDNKKINVHIAMSQNEEHYRTILYLASPILPDTW